MAYLEDDRYAKPADVLAQEFDGEAVLFNLKNETYFGLDEIGYRMFSLITTSRSLKAAFEAFLREFEVNPEQLQHDFEQLVNGLIDSDLIEKVDG
jgi:hypothetical protein